MLTAVFASVTQGIVVAGLSTYIHQDYQAGRKRRVGERSGMALNGIDISNWQSGINLAVVPCGDFVVIKATEGTGYVNPDYERAYRQAKTAGEMPGHLSLCVWWKYTGGGRIFSEECRGAVWGGNALCWTGKGGPIRHLV